MYIYANVALGYTVLHSCFHSPKHTENEEDYKKKKPSATNCGLAQDQTLSESGRKTTIIREHEYSIPMIS